MSWGRFFRPSNNDGTCRDDTLDGGAGSDNVYGRAGNDVLIYQADENAGAHDRYDGGAGRDTLQLEFTKQEWLSGVVQADIARFLSHLKTADNYCGSDPWFQFNAFDLDVRNIEKLAIRVDGVALDPRDQAVDAVADSASVAEGNAVSGNVLANDVAPDLVKAVQLLSAPAHGDLTFNADGSFSYSTGQYFDSLSQGETASETFTYRVTDADGDVDTATVTINVNGVNDGPVANADLAAADEDHGVAVDVTANDTDVDAHDTHGVVSAAITEGLGSVSISGGVVAYDPGAAYQSLGAGASATVVIDYAMADNHGATSASSLTLTVNGLNDRPTAVGDELTVEIPAGGSGAMRVAVIGTASSSHDAAAAQLEDSTVFDFDADTLLVSDFTSAAQWADALAGYDVVVVGGSGVGEEFGDTQLFSALRGFVDAGGGVVTTGWFAFTLEQMIESVQADADYISPLAVASYTYAELGTRITVLSPAHPITDGIAGYNVNTAFHEEATAVDGGATVLANGRSVSNNRDTAIAYDEVGEGLTVYVGGLFLASADFATDPLRSGVMDRIFEQAVSWAGGGASGGGNPLPESFTFAAADLLANDTDVDAGDILSIIAVSETSENGATLSIDADGNVVYVPGAVLGETDSFTYTVSDGNGGEESATVLLSFVDANESPML